MTVHDQPSSHAGTAPACYVCGGQLTVRRIGMYDVGICSSCGMGRIDGETKAGDYWLRDGGGVEATDAYWRARQSLFESALGRLETKSGPGRVLDFGGGVGYFAECALKRGWDAFSFDSSEVASQAAAERIGIARALTSDRTAEVMGTFDVVTLWCVVAHVTDPLELLKATYGFLKPGGRLVLTTPNFLFQATYARALAMIGRPVDFVAHDHLLHFTPSALGTILDRAGFQSHSYRYLGVAEYCVFERRLAHLLVPAKRLWNWAAVRTTAVGLPPLCAELQVIALKSPATDS